MAGTGCGSHRSYTAGCPACQRLTTHYDRRRRKLIAEGKWSAPVPVEQVAAHLAYLRAEGMSLRGVARAGNIAVNTLYAVARRRHQYVHGPTAAAIFSVQPQSVLPVGMVDTCGTTRRLRALVAAGYSLTDIAARLERHLTQVWEWAWARQETLSEAHAAAVADLYDRIAFTPGPSVRARNTGVRNDWPGPAAWDETTVDDPDAEPFGDLPDPDTIVDRVRAERALEGHRIELNDNERHFAVHLGHRKDMTHNAIALALGMSLSTARVLAAKPLPEDCEVAA